MFTRMLTSNQRVRRLYSWSINVTVVVLVLTIFTASSHATVQVGIDCPGFDTFVNDCIGDCLHGGVDCLKDPSAVTAINTDKASPHTVTINCDVTDPDSFHTEPDDNQDDPFDTDYYSCYDPDVGCNAVIDINNTFNTIYLAGDTCQVDPCASLIHELTHAAALVTGTRIFWTPESGQSPNQENAIQAENAYRRSAGLCIRGDAGTEDHQSLDPQYRLHCCGDLFNPGSCDNLGASYRCCSDNCVDLNSDTANCGNCGTTCSGACCTGSCTNLTTDSRNCGACGSPCGVVDLSYGAQITVSWLGGILYSQACVASQCECTGTNSVPSWANLQLCYPKRRGFSPVPADKHPRR